VTALLDDRIGEVYLSAADIAARVRELGADIARDYSQREPLLVGALKACVPFVTDLSMAIPVAHALDFLELAGYGTTGSRAAQLGGHERIRFIKDLDQEIAGRDVIVVDEVIDTGLTLHYLCRTLSLRNPESLACAALFDRPYRRLVDDLPVRYVGFTVTDEFFAGYGFDLDERWRNLPDVRFIKV
jgi:hypoxanthine phosphoribosyltransferase